MQQDFLAWLQRIIARPTIDRLRQSLADAMQRPPRFTALAAESDEPAAVAGLIRSLHAILDEPSQQEIRRFRYYDNLENFYVQSEELSTLIETKPDDPTSAYVAKVCYENNLGVKKTGKDLVAQYLTFKIYKCSPSDAAWPSYRKLSLSCVSIRL